MTRDEQIAAARELAERNPEWRWRPINVYGTYALTHWPTGAVVKQRGDGRWIASAGEAFPAIYAEDSPAAAIRALGFQINE